MIKISPERGVVIIIAFLTFGILLLLGTYFLSFTLSESRISESQLVASKTYYLAEAGINKAIWKLKNEDPWKTCFATSSIGYDCNCDNWQSSFEINILPNSTTTVSIINSECAYGQLTATSTIMTSEKKTAQRVVKTTVYKALAGPTENAAAMTGGASQNVSISNSNLKVYGNFFVDNILNIYTSDIEVIDSPSNFPEVDGKVLVTGNYQLHSGNAPSTTAICASDYCNTTSTCNCVVEADKFDLCNTGGCPPKNLNQPLVDFDSGQSTSFYQRALAAQNANQCQILCNGSLCSTSNCGGSPCNNKCIITASQLSSILGAVGTNGTATLNNEITYITGGGFTLNCKRLVVNGALVANGAVDIGTSNSCGANAQITINRPNSTSTSGLLAIGNTTFGQYSFLASTTLTGIIYAYNKKLEFNNLPQEVTIVGGIIGRKIDINNVTNLLTLELDNEVILYSLGYKINNVAINPIFSPIITTDHWEESY